jgi:hypothetical protein
MNGGGGSTGGELPVDEHCRRAPAEPLRPRVAWYTGYRQRGVPPARHRGLPSPFLTLIFTLDEPLTVLAHPDPGAREAKKKAQFRNVQAGNWAAEEAQG